MGEGRRGEPSGTCSSCKGSGIGRQILALHHVVNLTEIDDADHGFQRFAVVHYEGHGPIVTAYGYTDTGIGLAMDLPLEAILNARLGVFAERA